MFLLTNASVQTWIHCTFINGYSAAGLLSEGSRSNVLPTLYFLSQSPHLSPTHSTHEMQYIHSPNTRTVLYFIHTLYRVQRQFFSQTRKDHVVSHTYRLSQHYIHRNFPKELLVLSDLRTCPLHQPILIMDQVYFSTRCSVEVIIPRTANQK